MNIKESDWPKWANWAVQDADGWVCFYEKKPANNERESPDAWHSGSRYKLFRQYEDNTNWKSAIMKRPAITSSKARAPVTSLSVLQEVSRIQEERGAIYEGQEQERSMAKIVAIFNLHHGTQITEAQGWHFMEILKNVRLFNAPEYHHDSGVDGVSYAALKVEAKAKEKR